MVLKRIGVLSMAKITGILYAAMGVLAGLFFAFISSVFGMAGAHMNPDMPAWFAPMFGIGAIVFLPVLYGVMGVVFGALAAAIYNLFSGMIGGVELELEPRA